MNHYVPCTVLLIDKCSEERANMTRHLQQDSLYNYQIIEFSIAKEALNWCLEKTPEIILLDFASVNENASIFLEKLRSRLSNSQFTVILLIKPGDEDLAVRAMKSGAQDYLIKNQITPEILQRVIRHGMEKMYLMQQLAQTKAALQQSEHRYATLAEVVPVAIFRLDADGNCIYVNDRWSQITGEPIQAALGRGCLDTIHPEDSDRLFHQWTEVLTQEKMYCYEGKFLRKDGTTIWFYMQILPETGQNVTTIGYVGTLTDISEQQAALDDGLRPTIGDLIEAEAKLRKISERLTLAISSGRFGIWEFDCVQEKVIWDERMYELYGVHPEDFPGNFDAWLSFVHPDDQDYLLVTIQQVLHQNQEYDAEFQIIQPSGEIRVIKAYGVLNCDEQGKPILMVGINIDITERKQAEQELIHNRDLREVIFNESADALFLVDPVTLLTLDCNRRTVELFEATNKGELLGIEGRTLQRRPFTSNEIDTIVTQMQTKGFWSQEIEYVTLKGKLFWGNIAAKPITIAGRTLNLVRVTDINERKQAEEKLLRTNEQLAKANAELARATRLKDEFLANMSHELRTPLNAILGMSEGFIEGVFGAINQKQAKAIATIKRSGKHLLELINDILDLSKIESGKLELQISDVSVRSICDGSLTFIQQMALKKNICLSTHIGSNLDTIQVDDRRLRQVLINLLSNAVKFTPEGGNVKLTVWLEEVGTNETLGAEKLISQSSIPSPHICFRVTDTGIGIASEDISKLFQPFTQLDSSLNRNYTGTGLGLALVKRITTLHGGTILVNSEVGQGSCFTVRIPYLSGDNSLKKLQDPERVDLPATLIPKTLTIPVILLAEDNQANIDTISSYLESRGYEMVLAENGQQALDFAREKCPDLIIMDIQMPGMNGLEAIRQIRNEQKFIDIPIIALTALAMPSDRTTCLAAGANEYLTKPIKLKQLVLTIQQLLKNHQELHTSKYRKSD